MSDFDEHLLLTGEHYRAFDFLGAHPWEPREGQYEGTFFGVYAPNAKEVHVIGEHDGWSTDGAALKRVGNSGTVWEGYVEHAKPGQKYKYRILTQDGRWLEKADPFAFYNENPEGSNRASIIMGASRYRWQDGDWRRERDERFSEEHWKQQPISILETHLRYAFGKSERGDYRNFREIGQRLGDYARDMGYTHVELLPPAEHPFLGSGGYQVLGFFAPSARYGMPDDFRAMVDELHRRGLGVFVDDVSVHFPRDEYGLVDFDGTPVFSHPDPAVADVTDWGTLKFNFRSGFVRSFLKSKQNFWLEQFHVDGIRKDAVAAEIHASYSKENKGLPWENQLPNLGTVDQPGSVSSQYGRNLGQLVWEYGPRPELAYDAIQYEKEANYGLRQLHPSALIIAEESTAFPVESLGFHGKWGMGWMHDALEYFGLTEEGRAGAQGLLQKPTEYGATENFILPISHDEVTHSQGTLLQKMPGISDEEKLQNLRAFIGDWFFMQGGKLMMQGTEFASKREYNADDEVEWERLDGDIDAQQIRRFVNDNNWQYRIEPALKDRQYEPGGAEILPGSGQGVMVRLRKALGEDNDVVGITNTRAEDYPCYLIGVPRPGRYQRIMSSDAVAYGGLGRGDDVVVARPRTPADGLAASGAQYVLELRVPERSHQRFRRIGDS